jgi:CheY-like chemotaxis protein
MRNEPIQVLLADDDESDRLLFREAFKEIKMSTTVNTVNDGVELLEYLNTENVPLPHILFLDLNMPRKNGLECLREIKKNPDFKDIAIAIFSTSSSPNDIEQTFVQGANIFIRKPNDFEQLKKLLAKAIMMNWQYHTSGLNRDVFMLNLEA